MITGILHPSFLRIISFGSRLLGRPQRLFHQSRLSSDHTLLLIWVVQCPFMILFTAALERILRNAGI
ncbi:hypothetical protein SLE2022_001830 [Rubroshorea leprosula]